MQPPYNPHRPGEATTTIGMGDMLVVLLLLSMGGIGLAMAMREGLRP